MVRNSKELLVDAFVPEMLEGASWALAEITGDVCYFKSPGGFKETFQEKIDCCFSTGLLPVLPKL